jgi:hypothetical protein
MALGVLLHVVEHGDRRYEVDHLPSRQIVQIGPSELNVNTKNLYR